MARPSFAERWIRDNTGVALLLVGGALVGVGAFAVGPVAVATAMVGIGAVAMVLAVLLPRSEGQLKLGPSGLQVVLAAVEQKSDERGLEPELRAEAFAAALESLGNQPLLHRDLKPENLLRVSALRGPMMTLNFDEVIERAVDDVAAMVDVKPQEVPVEALRAVQTAGGVGDLPVVRAARRRAGRGAPRWELTTDLGHWRVSNTRHGWTARQLEES